MSRLASRPTKHPKTPIRTVSRRKILTVAVLASATPLPPCLAVGRAVPFASNGLNVAYKAMSMGKHVFVGKPIAHSIHETRTLRKLANQNNLITQMRNQGHAFKGIRLIREWHEADLDGQAGEVIGRTNRPEKGLGFTELIHADYPPAVPVSEDFDWDGWMGPVSPENRRSWETSRCPSTE